MLNILVNKRFLHFNGYATRFNCDELNNVVCHMTLEAKRTLLLYHTVRIIWNVMVHLVYRNDNLILVPGRYILRTPAMRTVRFQSSGVTVVFAYPPGKIQISMLSNIYRVTSILFPKGEAWVSKQVFPFWTIDTLNGIVSLTRYQEQLPRIPTSDPDIKDIIRLRRGVAETTEKFWRFHKDRAAVW